MRGHRAHAKVLTILFVLLSALPARVQSQSEAGDELLLEVWINGNTRNELARTVLRAGEISADCADLAAAGIRVPEVGAGISESGESVCSLTDRAGLRVSIDRHDQRLLISADSANLLPQIVDVRPDSVERAAKKLPPESAAGMILTYDGSLEATDLSQPGRTGVAGITLNLAAFEPWGAFRSDAFAVGSQALGISATRLDSTFTMEDPETLRIISLGDVITGDLEWTRPVRIAGVQIARDFLLQPDLVTQPMPQFFGDSAVPSTLDVFVNGMKLFEGKVQQGPFEIRDLPAQTGASDVTVVTTDVLGHQSLQTLSFYTPEQLLSEGLTAYTIDAGLLRQEYGIQSFSYGDLLATATARHGLTNWLTVEAHGEAAPSVADGGVGTLIAISPFGALSLSAAGSTSRSGTGFLGDLGYDASFKPFTFFGEATATSGNYRDIASLDGPVRPELRLQLGANVAVPGFGSLSMSMIDVRAQPERSRLVTATYSLSFLSGYEFNLVGFHDLQARASGAEIFLSIPIGPRNQAELSTRVGQGKPQGEATVVQSVNPDGGLGYSVSALTGASDGGEASAVWNGDTVSADARLSSIDGTNAAGVGVAGSLIELGGNVYVTRRIDGAVALVDAGQPNIRVYHENREVAVTGPDGTALVSGLVPYGSNTIGVSADDYPMDVLMSSPERTVVPNRFATLVNLAPRHGKPAVIELVLPDGTIPALGTHVQIRDRSGPLVVGAHGKVFVDDLPAPVTGDILLPAGKCAFLVVPSGPREGAIPEIGPVKCKMEAGRALPQSP